MVRLCHREEESECEEESREVRWVHVEGFMEVKGVVGKLEGKKKAETKKKKKVFCGSWRG